MRVIFDPQSDALSIVFREATVTTKPIAEGIAAEYDSEGVLVGLEVLDAAKRVGDGGVLDELVVQGLRSKTA